MSKLNSILLSRENATELTLALHELKGRAKVFPTAAVLIAAAERAEGRLSRAGIARSNRAGCLYAYRGAGSTSTSYQCWKTVLAYSMKRTAWGWFVVTAGNEYVYPKKQLLDRIDLTAKAKAAVLRAAMAGFGEIPAKAA
ncbi:hypothetical protein [Methylobacterium fujisawaense]|uniref:hypothetical protein n=1 Tax=Methylobacterium fujisawaense TaxID=107400 RepID=UPI0036FE7B5C